MLCKRLQMSIDVLISANYNEIASIIQHAAGVEQRGGGCIIKGYCIGKQYAICRRAANAGISMIM